MRDAELSILLVFLVGGLALGVVLAAVVTVASVLERR